MKSFAAIAVFGLAAIASAQTTTDVEDVSVTATDGATATVTATVEVTPTVDPTVEVTPTGSNTMTETSSSSSSSMSSAATGGLTPKVQSCLNAYQQCQGSYTDASTCSNQYSTCQAACKTTQAQCVAAGNGGATCAANAAVCLGYDPYSSGGASNTGANGAVTVTSVVQSFVTYCPGATQFSTNGQTYTATSAGYVTVTNCPCTITSVVGSTPTSPATGVSTGAANSTTYAGPKYTGAANKVIGASLSVVAAGAAFFALAL